ncbi:MAG: hypothetical protein CXT71_08415 [Methanobacteriota archaeon]|nr:MAG: hypothetical protein CXT71_08415 [Euryarchaeota archaeon]
MTDENPLTPPPPPGMPPAPPGMPPAPPGMPPAPPGMPPAPPGMPPAPSGMPPAPPGMPPAPPGMPAAPPEMPPAPMGMPPAPPSMPGAPPEMPPAPPEMPPAPMGMPPAPPSMPPAPPEMPPAPPEMPPAPPEMPLSPPGLDLLSPVVEEEIAEEEIAEEEVTEDESEDESEDEPAVDPLGALAPPGMPPAPPADPLAALAPPVPAEMPPAPPGMPPAPPADPLAALSPPVEETDIAIVDPLAPVAPVGDDFVAAGAKIRKSAEIDDVPGDKLEGSLHETEKSTLNAAGEVVKQDVKGVLTVRNPSSTDRIYDIDVMLNNTTNTNLAGDHIQVDELDSRKEFSTKYKVKNSRMLILRERLDTNPDRDQERSLSIAKGGEGGPLSLELEVENVCGVALNDVIVTRDVPEQITLIATGGSVLEDGILSWDIGHLGAGETQVLSLTGTVNVEGVKPVKAGIARAEYKADATLSTLTFRELDAFCRGFAYINSMESERPDNWECKTIFENRSSFTVDLVKLQVRMKGSEDLLFDIRDVSEDVLPDSRWESDTVTVESNGKPDFTWDLGYTVLPRANQSAEGKLELEPSTFEVLDSTLEKSYSKLILPSYRRNELTATLKMTNNGSSMINLMRITDDIPGVFEALAVEDISVKVGGADLAEDQYKAEVSAGITIEKELRSPDGPGHTLTMTIGTRGPINLGAGKTLTITYPLVAPDPSPGNEAVAGPARCEFSAERFGPVCARDAVEAPILRVRHHRRNFSAGKSVMPMGGKGRYEVLVLFENNGDTPLQDVIINDVLPSNFEIKDWSVRGNGRKERDDVSMNSIEAPEGASATSWIIPQVGKGERIELSFEIKGTGEVDAETLNQFHGVTFGDEVEDDDDQAPPIVEEISEEGDDDSSDEPGDGYKWREDVLVRIMEENGIDASLRDDFVRHAVNFDDDNNMYLKKVELENAAMAWDNSTSEEEEVAEEEVAEEEVAEEEVAEEEVAKKLLKKKLLKKKLLKKKLLKKKLLKKRFPMKLKKQKLA